MSEHEIEDIAREYILRGLEVARNYLVLDETHRGETTKERILVAFDNLCDVVNQTMGDRKNIW